MKVKDICNFLEQIAPLSLQESYDNSGLLVGNKEQEIAAVLISLDCTEAVVEEAVAKGCGLIVAHHPIIFGGLKKLTGENYVERTVIKAIQSNIAIYAIHTNIDNWHLGVNYKIAQRLGLSNTKVLQPLSQKLLKLVTFVPNKQKEEVANALFAAGAGDIGNYSHCSFSLPGEGTFMANDKANPFVGKINQLHTEAESRLEVVLPIWKKSQVVAALLAAHPYEEVAYDLYALQNATQLAGSGLIGDLDKPLTPSAFLNHLKMSMELEIIRFTTLKRQIQKIAVCGGAGSFLIKAAKAAGADAFVTADVKYHEFFDADQAIMIADIGHFESEKFTKTLLSELILEKFPTFAILLSGINTNPINYFS
ncbi:MAG: Nif3-like dinuclear metal center hexameric protein [Bacteroidetes bacterium]|jgi:dinuclear metal center YbgI/SA1388 family protein|nr:Nif3-like dinuclear metal center hexameric protein [Bacteroidota bacterium]